MLLFLFVFWQGVFLSFVVVVSTYLFIYLCIGLCIYVFTYLFIYLFAVDIIITISIISILKDEK